MFFPFHLLFTSIVPRNFGQDPMGDFDCKQFYTLYACTHWAVSPLLKNRPCLARVLAYVSFPRFLKRARQDFSFPCFANRFCLTLCIHPAKYPIRDCGNNNPANVNNKACFLSKWLPTLCALAVYQIVCTYLHISCFGVKFQLYLRGIFLIKEKTSNWSAWEDRWEMHPSPKRRRRIVKDWKKSTKGNINFHAIFPISVKNL